MLRSPLRHLGVWMPAILAAACQHPGETLVLDPPACAAGAAWDGVRCAPYARRTTQRVPTPWVEGGAPVTLELVAYAPLGAGPYPTLVFHHGSTGNGDDPALFGVTYESPGFARFFTERGWMVLFPQRRGRGGSGGLYDEGFTPERSRYSCVAAPALAGLERALQDADVVTAFVQTLADVDPGRLLLGGQSRGGILAAAHAERQRGVYRGVVNFVGGWIGEGCSDSGVVNRGTFTRAAAQPTSVLWLYGENDPFYSAAHSRANYDAFVAAGGSGTFRIYRRGDPAASGHGILAEASLWGTDVASFLAAVAR